MDFPIWTATQGGMMAEPATTIKYDNPLAYDPLRFQLKSMFSYELTNTVSIRLRNLKQRHNELSDAEYEELSNLIIVQNYLTKRLDELKPVT